MKSPPRGVACLVVAFSALAAAPETARATQAVPAESAEVAAHADDQRLAWRWHRLNAVDYASTALFAGTFFVFQFVLEPPSEASFRGGVLIDENVRSGILAKSNRGRRLAGRVSDLAALQPILVMTSDLIIASFSPESTGETAWQMAVIDVQAIALAGAVTRGIQAIVPRERPDVEPCLADEEYSDKCFRGPYQGFPGGHSATAFAAAGLVCAHRLKLPLYGGGAPDLAACLVATSSATATGILRMMSDRHYVSDIVVGSLIGAGAGFVLPALWHYRAEPKQSADVRWTVAPVCGPYACELLTLGWF